MHIDSIKIEFFKKIENVNLTNLGGVNVIVGGNGCGKSSVLQAVHFSVMASVAQKQTGQKTFSTEKLLYSPTSDFVVLRNGGPYKNVDSVDSYSMVTFGRFTILEDNKRLDYSCSIKLSKGKNHGNISCERVGDHQVLGAAVSNGRDLFSIYVPGLAGVAQREELKSKAIVRKGVASGEANLFLRNVIYYINQEDQLGQLNSIIEIIFPGCVVTVSFDEYVDTQINVSFVRGGRSDFIELAGTGFLQVLQIAAYIVYFKPKLLLLDEPDSHLHPNNQAVLCEALDYISEIHGTQIFLTTHSRHMVDALSDAANFVWLKEGAIEDQGERLNSVSMLMDIGALDDYDRFRAGAIDYIVLTEDSERKYLKKLLEFNGFDLSRLLVYSYKTSSKLDSAMLFVDFLKELDHVVHVIVHRDRDFMLPDEVAVVEQKVRQVGAIPFVTEHSDIEGYFVTPENIVAAGGFDAGEVVDFIESLSEYYDDDIRECYLNKRHEAHGFRLRHRLPASPVGETLIGNCVPVAVEYIKGKFLLKKVNGHLHEILGRSARLIGAGQDLRSERLAYIRANNT